MNKSVESIVESIMKFLTMDKKLMIEFILENTRQYSEEQLSEMDEDLIEHETKELLEWQDEDYLKELLEEYSMIS